MPQGSQEGGDGGAAGGAVAFQGKAARAASRRRWTAPRPAWPVKRRASQAEKRSRADAARGVGANRESIDAKSYHNCATAVRYPGPDGADDRGRDVRRHQYADP